VRAFLALLLPCVLLLSGCSDSRRNVKRAPGHPDVFATKLFEETQMLSAERLDPASTCERWASAPWCQTLIGGWSFVPETLELCGAESDEAAVIDCLSRVADREFSPLGLETCGALATPKHRRACLGAIGDRHLETPQYVYCAQQPSKKVAGCLADAHEYKFHPDELQRIVQRTTQDTPSTDARALIGSLEDNLADAYALDRSQWPDNYIYNFAGGATTHIRAMYCALDEYLLIVGAPINVNGYSGRYPAEVHDFVFTGLMHDFEEHDFESHDFTAGAWAYLPHGGHRVYATETPTYMLEYARGSVPGMLNFGIRHPRHATTRDRKNMKQQIRMCASRALAANKSKRQGRRELRQAKRQTVREIRKALRGQ